VAEWWHNNSGLNLLSGVEDDDDNPIRLADAVIVDFLRRIPAARLSFNRLLGTMLPAEQDRLNGLSMSAELMMSDAKAVEDAFQASQNKVGVYTAGPRGGSRAGGNN